jgi:hypothetical protein
MVEINLITQPHKERGSPLFHALFYLLTRLLSGGLQMKRVTGYITIGLFLLSISACVYLAEIYFFHRESDTFFYMMQDIAFVPIQVLLVSIIVEELLSRREKQAKLSKMNMAIGTFFSEAGTELLRLFAEFDLSVSRIRSRLLVKGEWTEKEFAGVGKFLAGYECSIDTGIRDLEGLKAYLLKKRPFMLSLLENPNLLEHESFTDLLFAVFHLTEELAVRKTVASLANPDYTHVANDLKRAYVLLLAEWITYVRHLKNAYPFIFSLVIRTNPFDPNASPEIK